MATRRPAYPVFHLLFVRTNYLREKESDADRDEATPRTPPPRAPRAGGDAEPPASVSSRELVEDSLRRTEAAQADLNAFRVIRAEEALGEAEAADRRIAEGRGRRRCSGSRSRSRKTSTSPGTRPCSAAAACPLGRARRRGGAAAARGGRDRDRQDPRPGGRPVALHRGALVRRDPQPLEHRPHAGRLERRRGGGGRRRSRPGGDRIRRSRLDPDPGRVDRSGRPRSPSAAGSRPARSGGVQRADLLRAAGTFRRRRGPPPRRGRTATPPATSIARRRRAEAFAESAAREPRALRIAISFATPFGVAGDVDPEHRAAIEAFAERLAELGHDVTPADPDYGLVGPAIIPRGMAGVDAWLNQRVGDRSNLEPRTRTHARFGRLLSGRRCGPHGRRSRRCVAGSAASSTASTLVLTPTTAKPPARSTSSTGAGTGRPAPRRAPPAPSGSPGTSSAGPGSAFPPGRPKPGCRSAPSCSAANTARRRCSNSRARSSARWAAGSRRPTPAAMRRHGQSREAARPVGEPGEGATGRPVREVELVLAQGVAGADRIDSHPHLHPVAVRERQRRPQHLGSHRPLSRDRRRRLEPAAAADRPAGEPERNAEAPSEPAAEGGDGEVALAALDRVDERRSASRRRPRGRRRRGGRARAGRPIAPPRRRR